MMNFNFVCKPWKESAPTEEKFVPVFPTGASSTYPLGQAARRGACDDEKHESQIYLSRSRRVVLPEVYCCIPR